jgi:sigma-E factor negative regulatory protein RseB
VSRRALVAVGTVTGAGALVVAGLAVLGSAPDPTLTADGVSGWTGRIDPAQVSDRAAMTPDDDVAVRLLARSAKAAGTVAYSGRAVTMTRSRTTTVELTHIPGSGTISLTVGAPATAARFAPDGRSGSFADDGRPLTLLRDNYRVLREAALDTSVAGRPAEAIVAVDADGTVDARYWLDTATGLLLRKELLDPAGAVRSRTGFVLLHLGVPAGTVVPAASPDPWTEPLSAAGLAAARTSGCACPESLPGGLLLLDARQAPAGSVSATPVVHQLFSDGVTTVSLFSISGGLSTADADGLTARGFHRQVLSGYDAWVRGGTADEPTVTVVWACHDDVLTLVTADAEDPLATAGAVVAALPPEPDAQDSSLLSRVARGWHRLTGGSS